MMQLNSKFSYPIYPHQQTGQDAVELRDSALQSELKYIDKGNAELSKIDKTLSGLDGQSANVKVLAMVAAQQKQVVMAMLNGNPEMAIAGILAQGIEQYAERLNSIQAWTQGGAGMFNEAMALMFEQLKESGSTSGYTLEDLFQLAVMDYMSNEYPSNTYNNTSMQHILESTGSGSHGYHEAWDGNRFSVKCREVFEHLLNNAPPGSLCHDILTYMNNTCGGVNALSNQFSSHYDDRGGFVCESNYPSNMGLSPMLRFAIMSSYLSEHPDIDQETIVMFLSGSIRELNDFVSSNTSYPSAIEFLFDNDGYPGSDVSGELGWRPISMHGLQVIDWNGQGLSMSYFENLYANFPARELTEDELKEVNRIGDQVRLLQETLKYWLSIIRDEKLLTVRNI